MLYSEESRVVINHSAFFGESNHFLYELLLAVAGNPDSPSKT